MQKYVDDVFVAGISMRKGMKYDRQAKALIWSLEKENLDREGSMNDEQRTMSIIAEMSSDILDCLNFMWDSPSCNKDDKIPLLDTQT